MGIEEEIKSTQQDIREALEAIGLSHRKFAGRYFDDTHPHSDDDKERSDFQENFKKQLQIGRKSPQILGQLQAYLRFIYAMPEFKKARLIAPRNITYPELNHEIWRGIRDISKSIDEALADRAATTDEE
ncbi:MAG: hypothetical protein OQJ98_03260 [Candidatus Pacebacteria bacterium]|nr:hypothetical protein [Candidatus Paceibacterota bacterium]